MLNEVIFRIRYDGERGPKLWSRPGQLPPFLAHRTKEQRVIGIKFVEECTGWGIVDENMRGDFRWEFVDEGIMIFVHDCTKSATPDVYLLNLDFEFLYLCFEFHVLGACAARLSI